MENLKEIRWKQRFENFEKSYKLLKKYSNQPIRTELERAGIIQFFEMTFELAWKVLKDYLESEGYMVKSPRETVKQAFQIGLIDNGHIWIDALSNRNLTTHTYDEELAEKMTKEILMAYLPELDSMYKKLSKEI
ncbi:nucleotidyltransferase [Paraclostridium benzoelyticum]|uniref:Nucleotidyltransferase n=1 Tax=Paraclostridium benzoelyticum TaxID=1629550 RepID=A0A0M3DHI7_9FIRM|nr:MULTISPECIES: nucleotidyltransferase substrate binding protein [Paraclostridium]KKY01788.1 nucleotidyltransferase [Paraclostridium benzoelyticum]MCE9675707.1 nucleotidyltransferase substrate binding protein [Paraclostridium bifermentans]MCR1876241.1 nucleotidyltransferase substrate binding protein [Paraclostridium bifermentans]OXX82989.1 nucleotidyltransferase [Paraclostridium benzoelyticum]UOW67260.1 nucleotidyltransferase substrate binding protein [Paraclostridium bifermentans]